MTRTRIILLLLFLVTALPASAFTWDEVGLAGRYRFVFDNVEYDTPPAPREDERTRMLQRLELSAVWRPLEWIELRAGLELEHDLADALEFETASIGNFKLLPRVSLALDAGEWGRITLGHFTPQPRRETVFFEATDHPAAGLDWRGEWWELWAARTGRVTADTKEVFLAGASAAPEFALGPLALTPRLAWAYSHSGGYDTAEYQDYSPPDGIRKLELYNLGAGLELAWREPRLWLGGGVFLSRNPDETAWGRLWRGEAGGRLGWFTLTLGYTQGEGYAGVRPHPELVPLPVLSSADGALLRLADIELRVEAPLTDWFVLAAAVEQAVYLDDSGTVSDNRNELILQAELVF